MNRDFIEQGACVGKDPEIFFPEQGSAGKEAKAICRTCVVIEECLEYGLHERIGVYGGMNSKERVRLVRERGAMARIIQFDETQPY